MGPAPPTPFFFFSEFRVFLVGGEGKGTKRSSSKATSAFAERFDELEPSHGDGPLLLQKSSETCVFPEPS